MAIKNNMDIDFVSSNGKDKRPIKNDQDGYEIVWSKPQEDKKIQLINDKSETKPDFSWRKKMVSFWNSIVLLIPKKKKIETSNPLKQIKSWGEKEELIIKTAPKVETINLPHVDLINEKSNNSTASTSPLSRITEKVLPRTVLKKEPSKIQPSNLSAPKPIQRPASVEKSVVIKPPIVVARREQIKKPNHFILGLRRLLANLFISKTTIVKYQDMGKIKEKKEASEGYTQAKAVVNPDVLRANLLTREISGFLKWGQKLFLPILFVVIPLFILAVAEISILSLSSQARADLENGKKDLGDLEAVSKSLDESSLPALLFREKIKNTGQLLNNHVYWTNFFDFLEKNTLKEVQYLGGFQGDLQGKFQFNARAKNLAQIKDQIRVFQSNPAVISAKVQTAQTSSVSDQEPYFDFDLTLELKPELWQR